MSGAPEKPRRREAAFLRARDGGSGWAEQEESPSGAEGLSYRTRRNSV